MTGGQASGRRTSSGRELRLIDGGQSGENADRGAGAYDHWKGLKDRGVAIIVREPLRLFYLHDLMYWCSLHSMK